MSKGILFLHSLELHMQLNTKNFLAILLLGVATIYFYYGFRGGETSTQTNTQKPTVSAEIIETDTGKRLETYANSGTDWGMTPFGSGKPLTEAEKEKPQFVKPNTEWKTRTLNINGQWITYEFGKGNPIQLALTPLNIQEESRACELNPSPLPRICREGMYGYITPEVEQGLKQTLESPLWENLIVKCEKEYSVSIDYIQFNQNILAPQALDISRFLIIDPDTGRKELETMEIQEVIRVLVSIGDLDSDSGIWKNSCMEQYGKPLYQMLENVSVLYSSNVAFSVQDNRFASP